MMARWGKEANNQYFQTRFLSLLSHSLHQLQTSLQSILCAFRGSFKDFWGHWGWFHILNSVFFFCEISLVYFYITCWFFPFYFLSNDFSMNALLFQLFFLINLVLLFSYYHFLLNKCILLQCYLFSPSNT